MSRGWALAAAIAGIAALPGCGGDDGTSKDSFITKANKICADGNDAVQLLAKQIDAAQRQSDPAKVYKDVGALTKKAAATSKPYIDRLDALDTPSADRDELKSWVADVRRQETLIDQLGTAFAKRAAARIARLSEQIDALDQRNNQFASAYGMKECAKSVTNE